MTTFELRCDSQTVVAWVKMALSNEKKIHVSGMYRLLIERRLSIVKELVRLHKLHVNVLWIPSHLNAADALTRTAKIPVQTINQCASVRSLIDVHNDTHFGVDRTLYLAHKYGISCNQQDVSNVVKSCSQCRLLIHIQ